MDESEELTALDDRSQVESSLDLQRLLTWLPPKAKQIIEQVKLNGMSISEAASKYGMSESAVKVSIHRGLKSLALLISKEDRI